MDLDEVDGGPPDLVLQEAAPGAQEGFVRGVGAQARDLLGHEVHGLGQLQQLHPQGLGVLPRGHPFQSHLTMDKQSMEAK